MAINAVGRTTIQGATTIGGFNPATLFSAGEQGVWYDPSDFSTLFQDSAGTIPVTALEQPVGRMLDKSGRGNHATQSTNTSFRPVVSARVNLLTQSEDVYAGVWNVFGGGSRQGQNVAVAPDGTLTADAIRLTSAGTNSNVYQQPTLAAGTYRFGIYVKRNAGSNQTFQLLQNIGGTATLSGDFTATDTWQFFSFNATGAAGASVIGVVGNVAGTQADLLVWGADLRPTNQGVGLPVYQRVGAAVAGTSTTVGNADYNANGFPVYLSFDGGDSLATSGIDFSATNKMSVFSGIRKLSSAAAQFIAELSATLGSNNGTFNLVVPNASPYQGLGYRSKGTLDVNADTANNAYPPPITVIASGTSDISAPSAILRVNGAQVASSTSSQGTGNYGNYPLYIGARGGSSFYYTGNLYGLIVRGASSTANQITGAENWLNQKTAAY